MSMAPYRFIVPQNTSSPTSLSIGSDSPVIIDWSSDEVPVIISPSTGTLSPGRILKVSPIFISSTGIISSIPLVILLPVCGVRLIKFFKPFLALSTVQSSKSAPNAIIHATSPAANTSPIKSDATIAIAINRAEEIHFSRINLTIARSSIGIPLIITVPHAGFK